MGGESLSSMVSANTVVASGWIAGSMELDTRSVFEGILTYVTVRQQNTDVSEVGGRNENIRLINDNLKQNNRRG